jgi:hypothetical protein
VLSPVGLKVIGAQLTIRLLPYKHMEGTDDDRMRDGANSPFLAPPGGYPMIQGVEITSEGGRRTKDIKQTKLSVEGADVEMTKVILH